MSTHDLELRLDRARWWLLSSQPFYGSLAMGLTDVFTNPHGKTACTDGRRIYWHPDFLGKLTDEEVRFVLMHETLHAAHGHLWRFPKADQRTNQACDYAINLCLAKIADANRAAGKPEGCKMPTGGLLNNAFEGLAEEEIYNRLPEPPPNGGGNSNDPCGDFTAPAEGPPGDEKGDSKPGNKPGQGKTPPGQDKGQNGQGNGQPEPQTLKDEWEQRVIQAAQAAKALGQGNLPADLQRQIDRTLRQKVDWKREMADFVKDAIASRNDWSRSCRRMATAPVIYPRRRRDETGLVIFCRDTSGSIGEETIGEFNGLIESCLADSGCSGIVLDCDAMVHAEHRIGAGECVPTKAVGGGGTAFEPVWERARELIDEGERIAGIVYLTDLYGSMPPGDDGIATLWLSTTDQQAPFGRTVRIEA